MLPLVLMIPDPPNMLPPVMLPEAEIIPVMLSPVVVTTTTFDVLVTLTLTFPLAATTTLELPFKRKLPADTVIPVSAAPLPIKLVAVILPVPETMPDPNNILPPVMLPDTLTVAPV